MVEGSFSALFLFTVYFFTVCKSVNSQIYFGIQPIHDGLFIFIFNCFVKLLNLVVLFACFNNNSRLLLFLFSFIGCYCELPRVTFYPDVVGIFLNK